MIEVGSILRVCAPMVIWDRAIPKIKFTEIPEESLVLVIDLEKVDQGQLRHQSMTFVTQFGSVVLIQCFEQYYFDEVRRVA